MAGWKPKSLLIVTNQQRKKTRGVYNAFGRAWCPAFNEYVAFNNEGFRHLIWQQERQRSKKEQTRRFALLTHAKDIIEKTHEYAAYRVEEKVSKAKWYGAKTKNVSRAQFWELNREIESRHISVIIRQVGNGKKHFFSIFERRNKKQPNM